MRFVKKERYKPFFKKILWLRENIPHTNKIFKFKKKKWEKFIIAYKRKLRRYKKFKPQDQSRYVVSKYPNKWSSYKNRSKISLQAYKIFNIFYGILRKKVIRKHIRLNLKEKKKSRDMSNKFLGRFEKRLDTVLYRAKFVRSIRTARQLIVHSKVFVNRRKVTTSSYVLKKGDLVSIDPEMSLLIKRSRIEIKIWPIPPKYLTINYRTLEIIFGDFDKTNLSTSIKLNLNLKKITTSQYKR